MSVYEWERGTIIIPADQWTNFRKTLIEAWNNHLTNQYNKCRRAYEAAKEAGKGKRGKNRHQAQLKAVARVCGGRFDTQWGSFESGDRDLWDLMVGMQGKVLKTKTWNGFEIAKVCAPKKGDFKKLPLTKDAVFDLPDASIILTNKTRTVVWDVPENNHAREHARAHFMAKRLFGLLNRVTWKRGSGGTIVGNDEYNRDSYESGGGGNYTVATYPPPPRPKTSYIRGWGW